MCEDNSAWVFGHLSGHRHSVLNIHKLDAAIKEHFMADQKDGRSHNQPSHDEQVKDGQHSHGGTSSDKSQPQQGQGNQRRPTHEESVKGGQQSHSGKKDEK